VTDQDQQVVKSIAIVTVAIAILGIVAFFIAQNVSDANKAKQQTTARSEQAMQARIEPVGKVNVGAAKAAGAAAVARSGKDVVQASCGGCHVAGVAGAPKIGSKGDWETRMQAGMDAMLASVINGKGIMPARGGGDFTDAELSDAIKTMLADSGM
jgi:cytochrome c5